MDSGLSLPAMIAIGVIAVLAIGAAVYLLFLRRPAPPKFDFEDDSDEVPIQTRAPAPRRSRPASVSQPARPEPVAQSTAEPSREMDPKLAKLHEKAKRRAKVLVQEIMMYNQEKLEKGRSEGNVMKYLNREIEMSKKLFQASAGIPDSDCDRYFEESMLAILAGGNPNLIQQVD